jgi:7,8-dihydropterin-6-yl-methyl-4-(beta-D-ribofuranosyl)aminobenzene 5'-phosphate synthase
MGVQITTLIENSLGEHTGLETEHGISFLIETEEASILFDTGQSGAFIRNAEKLQKDLSSVTQVVLSHGHYDHTGGLRAFAAQPYAQECTVWVGDGFFEKKYGKFGPSYQFLGNDFDQLFLQQQGMSCTTVKENKVEISPGVWVVTQFTRTYAQEQDNPRFVLIDEETGTETVDDFHDEVLVVVETEKGLVVLVGCSHPGILNMIQTVGQLFTEQIYLLLGGTHLVEADDARIDRAIETCIDAHISQLGISHCTGERAVAKMEKASENFFRNCTGTSLRIG